MFALHSVLQEKSNVISLAQFSVWGLRSFILTLQTRTEISFRLVLFAASGTCLRKKTEFSKLRNYWSYCALKIFCKHSKSLKLHASLFHCKQTNLNSNERYLSLQTCLARTEQMLSSLQVVSPTKSLTRDVISWDLVPQHPIGSDFFYSFLLFLLYLFSKNRVSSRNSFINWVKLVIHFRATISNWETTSLSK